MKFAKRHKLGTLLTLIGVVLWLYTGIDYLILLAPIVFIAGIALRAFPRTLLWIALGAYGALIMAPNGWFIVLVGCIVCMSLPWTRGITPVADFKVKANPKQRQEA